MRELNLSGVIYVQAVQDRFLRQLPQRTVSALAASSKIYRDAGSESGRSSQQFINLISVVDDVFAYGH